MLAAAKLLISIRIAPPASTVQSLRWAFPLNEVFMALILP
jgi:hypothetical protein